MEGFLPMSRASFMLDFIVLAMGAIVPILFLSIYLVRRKRQFALHRKIQITLGVVLGLAILAFELDMRIFGWRQYAEPSPYFQTFVFPALYVHLCFAVPTLCLWVYTLSMALRHRIATETNQQRIQHKRWGHWSALGMLGTSFSGCLFFWLAFMA